MPHSASATAAGLSAEAGSGLTPVVTFVFAVACGAMVANIYYAQSLIGLISPDLHLQTNLAGLIVTLTQLGYGAGLLFLVSLGDLVENRKLILITSSGVILGLVGVATSHSADIYLLSSFVVGLCSVGAQMLVPLAAHLAPDRTRGRVIGNIMSGLLAGIMLARPLASFVAAYLGWRAIFSLSAAIMLGIVAVLWRVLPRRQPRPGLHYGHILASTLAMFARFPALRRRAAYQGLLFAAFSLFWTAAPLMLRDSFGLSQQGIALFALAGAGGALAAPLAGRLADRGLTRPATALALVCVIFSFLAAGFAAAAGQVLLLAVAAIALDSAVQTNQVLSQRIIYSLAPEARGRLNAAFLTAIFACGSVSSAVSTYAYVEGGWWLTALIGAGLGAIALALFAGELLGRRA